MTSADAVRYPGSMLTGRPAAPESLRRSSSRTDRPQLQGRERFRPRELPEAHEPPLQVPAHLGLVIIGQIEGEGGALEIDLSPVAFEDPRTLP